MSPNIYTDSVFSTSIPKVLDKTRLKPFIQAVCRLGQVPWAIAINSLIGAINQPVCAMYRYNNIVQKKTQTSLYILTLAEPRTGKSFAYGMTHVAYKKEQTRLLDKAMEEWSNYHEAKAVYDKTPMQLKHTVPYPTEPKEQLIGTSQFTRAGLQRVLREHSPYLSFSTSEAASFFTGFNTKQENLTETLNTFNKLFEGDIVDNLLKEKVGKGTEAITGTFCIDAMVQPAQAKKLLTNPQLAEQGSVGRFLMLEADNLKKHRTIAEISLLAGAEHRQEDEELMAIFTEVNTALWKEITCTGKTEASLGKVNTREVDFFTTQNAEFTKLKMRYDTYIKSIETNYEHPLHMIMNNLERSWDLIERLAVNLQVFYDKYDLIRSNFLLKREGTNSVSIECVKEAIALMTFYLEHAQKILCDSGQNFIPKEFSEMLEPIESFKKYILKDGKKSFKRRELQMTVRALRGTDAMQKFLDFMSDYDFIARDKENLAIYNVLVDVATIDIEKLGIQYARKYDGFNPYLDDEKEPEPEDGAPIPDPLNEAFWAEQEKKAQKTVEEFTAVSESAIQARTEEVDAVNRESSIESTTPCATSLKYDSAKFENNLARDERFRECVASTKLERCILDEARKRCGTLTRLSEGVYQAKCCFHTEKTGSLTFYRQTNRFHCFGCGKTGDIIAFLMEFGLDFHEAIGFSKVTNDSSQAVLSEEERNRLEALALKREQEEEIAARRKADSFLTFKRENYDNVEHSEVPTQYIANRCGGRMLAVDSAIKYNLTTDYYDAITNTNITKPCIIVPYQTNDGIVTGLHRLYYNTSTQDLVKDTTTGKRKKEFKGSYKGSYAVVYRANNNPTVILCEGIETGYGIMSLLLEKDKCFSEIKLNELPNIYSVGSSNNYDLDLPNYIKYVVICADVDKSGIGQSKAHEAKPKLEEKGYKVKIITPPFARDEYGDFLDYANTKK